MLLKAGPLRGDTFRIKKDWDSLEQPSWSSKLGKVFRRHGMPNGPWYALGGDNWGYATTGRSSQFFDVKVADQAERDNIVDDLIAAGFEVIDDRPTPLHVGQPYRESLTSMKHLTEVLTGFKSLNTVARDGVAGNVMTNLNGDQSLVTRQGGNVIDDAEAEEENTEVKQKRAACVLVFHRDGERILGVSRKTDPNDFGMPGGKVDPGETPEEAAVRETKEETGFDAYDLEHVFTRQDAGGYTTYTFLAKIDGEFDTDEAGVVRWVTPETLLNGSFGEYNRRLFQRLGIV